MSEVRREVVIKLVIEVCINFEVGNVLWEIDIWSGIVSIFIRVCYTISYFFGFEEG